MAKVEFGVFMNELDVVGFAKEAESLGFDWVSAGESMANVTPFDTLTALTAAAMVTQRVKLITSILMVPLHQPVMLAKRIATLDVLSKGRFNLGTGVGGERPVDFETSGMPIKQRGSRTDEALQVMIKLWTEKNVTFQGKYTKISNYTLSPETVQKPHPPIWIGGRREPAMRRAAKYGDGWFPYRYSPKEVASSIETIKRIAKENGRTIEHFPTAAIVYAAPAVSREEGQRMAIKRLGGYHNNDFSKIDFSKLVDRSAVCGTPADIIPRLREYVAAGVNPIIFNWGLPAERVRAGMRTLAQEVLPAFR